MPSGTQERKKKKNETQSVELGIRYKIMTHITSKYRSLLSLLLSFLYLEKISMQTKLPLMLCLRNEYSWDVERFHEYMYFDYVF